MSGDHPAASETDDSVVRIAVIGDVHLRWCENDVEYFNSSAYDLILFVGDLATYAHRRAIPTAATISKLRLPTLVIPGNHDGINVSQLVAEVTENGALSDLLSGGQQKRCRQLDEALSPIALCGYSLHPFEIRDQRFAVVSARPHSMGGPRLSFRRHLTERFGIRDLEESAQRLCRLIDESPYDRLLILSHNGPTGLGDKRDDPWGCDFRPNQGDFGDPDLRQAIEYASHNGKCVAAVIAGHMHHSVKGGGQRRWLERQGDTLYVNAARVPRIFRAADEIYRHHVAVTLCGTKAEAREVFIPGTASDMRKERRA